MSKAKRLFINLVIAVILLASSAIAEVPELINYQGRLLDSTGMPISDGAYQIKFKIYSSETGDDSLWSSGFQSVQVTGGIINYTLGSNTPIPNDLFSTGSERYIDISVDANQEYTPRIRLTSVAYSQQAAHADTAQYAHASSGSNQLWTVLDSVIYTNNFWGIARGNAGNALYGDNAHTHINIGVECTTGNEDQNDSYITISGGLNNRAESSFTVISGGRSNTIDGLVSVIGGGYYNNANGDFSTIAGGYSNNAIGDFSTIAGGRTNRAGSNYSTITGGNFNIVNGDYSSIIGGSVNLISGPYSNDYSTIGGGQGNRLSGSWSVIAGGKSNRVYSDYGTIGGGLENVSYGFSVVAGGRHDSAFGPASAIGGGEINVTWGSYSTIGGGLRNFTTESSSGGTVGGGYNNIVRGRYSSILGGYNNHIDSNAHYSYLFGINGHLTQDSSFMVDMPHIRFGPEVGGYEFPRLSSPQEPSILVNDGYGQLNWEPAANSQGDITSVYAGYGLFGGGTQGDVSISVVAPMVLDATSDGYAFYGRSGHSGSVGIMGENLSTGTVGTLGSLWGVYGVNPDSGTIGALGGSCGIYARHSESGDSVKLADGWFAGHFYGSCLFRENIYVNGEIVNKNAGIKIDHPITPENKYLKQAYISSSEMASVYSGNVILDSNGEAKVMLADYIESLNDDFRYQLTCVGGYAPVYISQKISNGTFVIAGGLPGLEISWQITGIRKDPCALANPIEVEQEKEANEKGKYLNPEVYGLGHEYGIFHRSDTEKKD